MAERFYNHSRRITLVVLVVLFDLARINGHPFNRSESNEQPNSSSRSLDRMQRSGPVPKCEDTTFCVDTPYYPYDYVASMLSMNRDLKFLATLDAPSGISERIQYTDDGEALCSSTVKYNIKAIMKIRQGNCRREMGHQEEVVRPKTALSINDRWLYVVNNDDYLQTVRVEICKSQDRVCNIIDGFADGYTTKCKQTYIYRQMVAIGTGGKVAPELFKLPASCKCFVKFTGDPLLRMGVSLGKVKKQSPVSSKNQWN